MDASRAGLHTRDLIDNIHSLDHLAKDAIAGLTGSLVVVEKGVVLDVDVKLGRGAVRSGRSKIPFCRASLRPSGDLVGLASFDYREWSDGGACASGRGFVS